MGPSPVVTVVIPCYNGEAYLESAVRSVMDQTFGDWHLVLVDDASSDGTLRLAEQLAERAARMSVVALSENRGRCYARNRGSQVNRSEFVAFLDQDDRYDPEFLSATLQVLQDRPYVDAARALPQLSVDVKPEQYRSIAESLMNTTVFRRKAFEFIGGWPDRPFFREAKYGGEDIALRNLFTMIFTEAVLHRPLYHYSHRPGNALDQFLARSDVEDGKLVLRSEHDEGQKMVQEVSQLKQEFAIRLRQFIYEHFSGKLP